MELSANAREAITSKISSAVKILSDIPEGMSASGFIFKIIDFLPDASLEVRVTYRSITDKDNTRNVYLTLNSLRWYGFSIGVPAWINQFTDTYSIAEDFHQSTIVDAIKAIIGDSLEIVHVCFTVKLEMEFEEYGTMVIYLDAVEKLQIGDDVSIDATSLTNNSINNSQSNDTLNYNILRNLLREDTDR